jgi:translocation and assembly module TamA
MRARRLAPLLVLALASCAVPRGTPEHPKVSAFELRGVKALDAGDLKSRLATQGPDPWWHLFWRDAHDLDEDAVANDRRRIERAYRAEGYFQAKVSPPEFIADGRGRVKVRLDVTEGIPARVSELRINGLEGAPEAADQLRNLPLREGGRFTEGAFDATRAQIAKALSTSGYAQAEVTQLAQVDPGTGATRVTYNVVAGTRYKFGGVFVSGTSAIPRDRVRQEADLVFRPGDWFDATALQRTQARVFDLGVFGGVRVTPGPADEQKRTIPVLISAREAPFRTLRAGPGVAVQLNRWDVNVTAGWHHRNWLGGLRKLNLDLRVGYAWLPSPFNPTKQGLVALASADFTQPGAIRHRLDVTTRVELERGLEEAYSYYAERFRVGTPFRYSILQLIPSYNIELYQVTGAVQFDPTVTGSAQLLQSCSGSICLLSYFEQRVNLDLRDDVINTRRGIFLSFAIQEGFTIGGYGFPYLRLLPEGRVFLPMGKNLVLAGRLRVGILHSLNDKPPPVVAVFYSGGPTQMRGYYTRRLSPYAVDYKTGDLVPVGGPGLSDGSLELRFPLGGSLASAIFLDFGNVTVTQAEALDPGALQYAVGVGLRYRTVFGPLRVDLATRLPRRTSQGWQYPTLPIVNAVPGALSTHGEPLVTFHFSVGEAF